MKKKLIILLVGMAMILGVTGCKDNTADVDPVEIEPVVETEPTEIEPEPEDEIVNLDTEYFDPSNQVWGGTELILDAGENEFTQEVGEVAEGEQIGSFVFDLDDDGKQEAIVVAGEDIGKYWESTDSTFWNVSQVWFVDENKQVSVISEAFAAKEMYTDQHIVEKDGKKYLVLNLCYPDSAGLCGVYSLENDSLIALGGLNQNGYVYVSPENEFVWNESGYKQSFIEPEEGEKMIDLCGMGIAYIPYAFSVDGTKAVFEAAKTVSLDEVTALAEFDASEYEKADAFEYIIRGDKELEVNCAVLSYGCYEFTTHIFKLSDDGTAWVKQRSIYGFYNENPTELSGWDFLNNPYKK